MTPPAQSLQAGSFLEVSLARFVQMTGIPKAQLNNYSTITFVNSSKIAKISSINRISLVGIDNSIAAVRGALIFAFEGIL